MNKKILSLLLTFVLAFTSITFSVPVTKANADTVYYGDVDGDGRVTIVDATLIQKYCYGIITLTLDQKKRGDVDFNGQITENDATLIQKYSLKFFAEFKRPLYGDADRDGIVTFKDAVSVQKFSLKINVDIDETAADVNFDGKINILDATLIQKYVLGILETFEEYTIKYNSNGGSGCMEYQNIGMFDTVKLSPNQFRRTGFAFAGWKIKRGNEWLQDDNGNDRIFTDQCEISELSTESKRILAAYAQWKSVQFSGVYEITPRHAIYKCISIAEGSTENYSNAHLYSNYHCTYQRFMLRFTGMANCYYIYDTNSNKVLEAESSNITNGTNVRLNQYTGAADQIWYLENIGNGYYYICSYLNTKYVFDINNSSTSNGANLQLFEKRGYNNQQFKLNNILDLNKAYQIMPRLSSSACVDVRGAGTDNGTNIQYDEYASKPQQQFNFSLQPDGSYVIYSCLSDKVLTVQGDKAQDYANVALYSFENKTSQKWFLQIVNNGYYYFASALNQNYVLNIHNGYTNNGTNIELLKKNGGYNQQFKIQEAAWTQIEGGTFNLQVLNERYINFQKEDTNNTDYDLTSTFNNESNYGSMFAFEWENAKYNIRSMGEYLVYDPSIQVTEDNSNIVFNECKSEIKWYLECAGNGYFYIHNTQDSKKFIYQNNEITYDCFKLIRCGNLSYYNNRVAKVNIGINNLRDKRKYPFTIIRDDNSNNKVCGPWKLVCQ